MKRKQFLQQTSSSLHFLLSLPPLPRSNLLPSHPPLLHPNGCIHLGYIHERNWRPLSRFQHRQATIQHINSQSRCSIKSSPSTSGEDLPVWCSRSYTWFAPVKHPRMWYLPHGRCRQRTVWRGWCRRRQGWRARRRYGRNAW